MDKDSKKKGINLMPEDMRSKESGVLSKIKSKADFDFDFDFVSPEDSSLKKSSQKLGPSFWTKIKKSFSKPKRFGESTTKISKEKKDTNTGERPKIIYNPNQKDKRPEKKEESLHISTPIKKEDKYTANFATDYKDSILEDKLSSTKISKDSKIGRVIAKPIIARDTVVKEQKEIPQLAKLDKDKVNGAAREGGLGYKIKFKPDIKIKKEEKLEKKLPKKQGFSFWDKFKKLFSRKAKAPKSPKIEKVLAKSIVPRDIKENKPADFSIPVMDGLDNKTSFDKKITDTKKQKISKFHQPQPRIRAKLLDNGGGVDLIPASAKTRSWRQVINLLLIACLGAVVIVGIFYGFLFYQGYNIESQKNNKSEQITNLEIQIIEYKDLNDDITQLGDEIKSIHKLLSFHFYWTNFFQLLEKYTIEGVYYSGLAAGNGGALTLNVKASDFDTLARQIKVLEQEEAMEFVVSVNVSSATYNDVSDDVSFDMTLVLNPLLFTYNENYIYEIDDSSSNEEASEE